MQFRSVVHAKGLDSHAACTAAGSEPHSRQASTLVRFLRARGGDCEAAAKMLQGALDWRRDFDIDAKLRAWRPEWDEGASARVRLIKTFTYIAELGPDNEGMTVILHRHSQADLGGLVREVGSEPLLLYMVSMIEGQFEVARARMLKTGNFLTNFIEIHDVGNYGYVGGYLSRGVGAAAFFKTASPVFDNVYPERLRVCFLVRMPLAFTAVWRMFSPMVPPATKNKIRLKGYAASSWIDEMRELIPEDVIPAFLRGDLASDLAKATPWGGYVPKDALHTFEKDASTQPNAGMR